MEKILEIDKFKTYCEHCERIFKNVWNCKMNSIVGTRYALLCTGCQKLIGIYFSEEYNDLVKSSNIISNEARISNFNELIII